MPTELVAEATTGALGIGEVRQRGDVDTGPCAQWQSAPSKEIHHQVGPGRRGGKSPSTRHRALEGGPVNGRRRTCKSIYKLTYLRPRGKGERAPPPPRPDDGHSQQDRAKSQETHVP